MARDFVLKAKLLPDRDAVSRIVTKVKERPNDPKWLDDLRSASPSTLIAAIGEFGGAGDHDAARAAAQALIQEKLTTATIEAIDRLNTATAFLSRVGVAVAIVGTIATVVGLFR